MLAGIPGAEAYEDATGTAGLQQSKIEELQYLAQLGSLDDLYLDIVSPPFQACPLLIQPSEEKSFYTLPSASLEILRRHSRSRTGSVNRREQIERVRYGGIEEEELSTNYIIELAAANFIQSKLGSSGNAMSHPYGTAFFGLSGELGNDDVQLVQDLMSCAEKVSNRDSATKLLQDCQNRSFGQANKIQRLVYYFTEALRQKIQHQSGKRSNEIAMNAIASDPTAASSATAAFFRKVPFSQITQFAAIQEFIEHLSDYRKVHVIELEIRCGILELILMQALAARSECPIEHFKVTAIATGSSNLLLIEETGDRLRSLASSLNVDFSFHVIMLEDIIVNPQLSLFDLDSEETALVHGSHALEKMVSKPKQLETLIKVIKRLNPCAMIIVEAEANVNSPIFVNRFVEALFFFGAYFDSLEDCLKNDVQERRFVESRLLGSVIRDTVAAEGVERQHRIVGVNVWRAFFARLGIVEMALSKLAIDHANLVLKSFDCRDSCTLGFNGDSLIVNWKGTPICSLSVWKF